MISNILKQQHLLEAIPLEDLTTKTRRQVRFPELDSALANWVGWCENRGVCVTGEAMRIKAERFARILKIEKPLTWSNDGLQKFNSRHGFGSVNSHGERGSAATVSISDLQRKLKQYDLRNIFNMDETGLFFFVAA
ncbi:hypothetical protein JG688_00016355 [Phytophthora aleatoria]|uniref:HTH CENPB-type domain-containing protein n=1 Tax=Phytophthora aleatoria TaxID=2496075 RepID=A0A8J5IUD3_9STRA|nr:hypothetical protein JG688_00016355 [Phytophthora aleatoria]